MNTKNNGTLHQTNHYTWERRDQLIFAIFLQSVSAFFLLAIYSYVKNVAPKINLNASAQIPIENWMGTIGAHTAEYLFIDLCGINAFFIPLFPFAISLKLFFPQSQYNLLKTLILLTFLTIWSTIAMGYFHYICQNTLIPWYMAPGLISIKITTTLGNLLGVGVILILTSSLISLAIALLFDPMITLRSWQEKIKKSPTQKTTDNTSEENNNTTNTSENNTQNHTIPQPSTEINKEKNPLEDTTEVTEVE